MAAVSEGVLTDYAIWRPGCPDGVGDIYQGRVIATVPGMAGAFIALARDTEGFLPDSAGAAGLGTGDAVAVEVTRAAQGGKGPRLKRRDENPGLGAPALLRRGPNPVLRLAALHPGPVFIDDPAVFASLRPALRDRAIQAEAWDEHLHSAIAALADPVVALPGGLRATIEPTAALVAIDVDMAGATAGRDAKAAKQEAANRAALPVLARQIRLRNLAGAILIDLAGMSLRRRPALADAVRSALMPDPAHPRLLGFTAGGLIEIQRPRTRPPLHEMLAGPHAAGLAALREIAGADPARPPVLRAAPDVVSALESDPVALPALANRLGRPLLLRSDPALSPGATIIEERARG